jgi:ribosome-associated protein
VAKSKKKTKPAKPKKPARKTRTRIKPRATKKAPAKAKFRAKAKPKAKPKALRPVRKTAKKSSAKKPVLKRTIGGLPGKLYDAAIQVLNERQAEHIVTVELGGRSSMADYLIVASGRAQRQIVAIADYLRAAFMKLGVSQVRIEGLPEANWVLVDAGDIVVHLFRPEVRDYYRIEEIWNRKGR